MQTHTCLYACVCVQPTRWIARKQQVKGVPKVKAVVLNSIDKQAHEMDEVWLHREM